MKDQDFRNRQAKLLQTREELGPAEGVRACEVLLGEGQLSEVQTARVTFIRAQFRMELTPSLVDAPKKLRDSIAMMRQHYVAGHPDRDQVEMVDRHFFGPRDTSVTAWKTHAQAGELVNQGQHEAARDLLVPLEDHPNVVLRAFVKLGLMSLSANLDDHERALHLAKNAADLVERLEVGHWARRSVEKLVLSRVCIIRKTVFPEPLLSSLSAAIGAVNEGSTDALKLWESALSEVKKSGLPGPIDEAQRIDRLLTGFEGPLALLVAFRSMKQARESGGEKAILDATEAAYYIAYEHDAHTTIRELEDFLVQAGRF